VLARINQRNSECHAYLTIGIEQARASALAIDAGMSLARSSPLGGVPYACKDLIETRGLRTTCGSRALEDWQPSQDAAVVERLAAAGGILIGKTNLHEFAYGATGVNPHFGTPPNPWDHNRLAGGSSSGSAVAVAEGLASFALGTDTGGSVRVPAALCGIIGLKPTYGLISRVGVIPFCWTLDHVGILALSVNDIATVLQVLAGYDARDSSSVDLPVPDYLSELETGIRGQRVGVPRQFFFESADPEILEATQHAINIMRRLGARVTEIDMPDLAQSRTVSLLIQLPEALSYHRRYLPQKALLYGADLRAGLALAQFILAEHYVQAKRMIEFYRQAIATIFDEVDLLVTPTCPIVAPEIGATEITIGGTKEVIGNALTRYTSLFNMTGHPAVSLPSGLHSLGLPMAVQLVGRPFAEAELLRVARALEREIGPVVNQMS
jgi:aspartyl-tRNA(Asn)/glutamyl-tRNA(Gln) amidotransferase subunit A